MKKIQEYLNSINESQKCGICSSFEDDDVIKASFKGDDYLVSRHAFASGNFGVGAGLHFAKLVDDPDKYWIVKLSKTDKIQERYSTDPYNYGYEVENYYCPACGKKLR